MNPDFYQIDLDKLRSYQPKLAQAFPDSAVALDGKPFYNLASGWHIDVRSLTTGALATYIPCYWLTPDPTPEYRVIVTDPVGTVVENTKYQGVPAGFNFLLGELIKPEFQWVGFKYGSHRVSIERVG